MSTLHHLGRTIEQSSMGWGGEAGPSTIHQPDELSGGEHLTEPFVMTGADLYRVSCRSCHRANGTGAPPEINSLLGPVRSASVAWETERMKKLGATVDASFVRSLAEQSEGDLQKRLHRGGHDMPAFAYLSDREIAVLRPYLDELAGLPGAASRQRTLRVPVARVGELIVKGTCHVCHDATSPNVNQPTVLSGMIPALGNIPHEWTIYFVVNKVTRGAPVPLGSGNVSSRGRMPVFGYLTDREAASAYLYLIMYPPRA